MIDKARRHLSEFVNRGLILRLKFIEIFRDQIVKINLIAEEISRTECFATSNIFWRRFDDEVNVKSGAGREEENIFRIKN